MDHETAATVALTALSYILDREELRHRFLALTGLDQESLARRADDPELLAGVLDFLLEDEPSLLAFCDSVNLPPETPARARRALPGAQPHG